MMLQPPAVVVAPPPAAGAAHRGDPEGPDPAAVNFAAEEDVAGRNRIREIDVWGPGAFSGPRRSTEIASSAACSARAACDFTGTV
jgi:hypothetical protein